MFGPTKVALALPSLLVIVFQKYVWVSASSRHLVTGKIMLSSYMGKLCYYFCLDFYGENMVNLINRMVSM